MIETLFSLVLFLFPLAYSPGPGNIFFAANGARFGMLATIPANVGYHIATWLVTVLIGLGLMTTLQNSPDVFLVLKIAGTLYVLRIAWKMFFSGVADNPADARPASFMDGAVLLLLNPKAYVIIALMFTQFLRAPDEEHLPLILAITTVFTLNNFLAFSVWTAIGGRLSKCFAQAGSARMLNMTFGTVLTAVAIWMCFA
ncbi:LysE family translocator [Hwanghaeella grinnelliae]|uniref:LysE family translocator n=1 Tax=Hwanghaeella grinnelliae TaxID=2500179 RepID=A0A3S2WSN5_9PROT|nr:LysE family translocator [Hwanghaeella grinnelliae]RVU36859.1 LysE family translocator [Hwanghaeella grinnelliae]